jgi:hypothetical protein
MEQSLINNIAEAALILAFLFFAAVAILFVIRRFNLIDIYGLAGSQNIQILEMKYINNFNMLVIIQFNQEVIFMLMGRGHSQIISRYSL